MAISDIGTDGYIGYGADGYIGHGADGHDVAIIPIKF